MNVNDTVVYVSWEIVNDIAIITIKFGKSINKSFYPVGQKEHNVILN